MNLAGVIADPRRAIRPVDKGLSDEFIEARRAEENSLPASGRYCHTLFEHGICTRDFGHDGPHYVHYPFLR